MAPGKFAETRAAKQRATPHPAFGRLPQQAGEGVRTHDPRCVNVVAFDEGGCACIGEIRTLREKLVERRATDRSRPEEMGGSEKGRGADQNAETFNHLCPCHARSSICKASATSAELLFEG